MECQRRKIEDREDRENRRTEERGRESNSHSPSDALFGHIRTTLIDDHIEY